MGLFDFVKNKKTELTEEQLKWNKMWEMWANEQVDSPYAELMTYQSEIYNGGHSQYFTNVSNTNDLKKEMLSLETILPSQLRETLKIAYEAYLVLEENDDEKAEQIIEQCDDRFYENEEEINRILKEYAAKIEL
jgi:hypothetical protein